MVHEEILSKVCLKIQEIRGLAIDNRQMVERSSGLMGADAGIMLFLYHYARVLGDEEAGRKAEELTERFMERLPEAGSASYCDGWAGILTCLDYLRRCWYVDVETAEVMEDVERGMEVYTEQCLRRRMFELLYGSAGTGLYWLARGDREMTGRIVNAMYECKEIDGRSGSYKWRLGSMRAADGLRYNLSMSHGIVGALLFLLRVDEKYNDEAAREMVEGGIRYLLSLKGDGKDGISLFPSVTDGDGYLSRRNSRLGWCYGDLGCAYLLYEASCVYGRDAWREAAMEIYRHAAGRRTRETSLVVDAGLCHGAAGIAMMFDDIYGKAEDAVFRECADYWMGQTLSHACFPDGVAGYRTFYVNDWYNDFSLLTGVSGIGLMMLSYISGERGWYRLLLP